MHVVVGLGNPGQKYENTRHSVGFRVVGELAHRYAAGKPQLKFEAEVADIFVAEEKTLLAAPQTFMNESGRSVRKIVDFYNLELESVLIVCDDMNLDVGRLRMRASGSAGGQKGLDDIIRRMGTQEIPRLRIGIGRPPGQMNSSNYVLGRFNSEDRETIDREILLAADGVETWIRQGTELAMNQINAPAAD